MTESTSWSSGFRAGVCEMAKASEDACIVVDAAMRVVCANDGAGRFYGMEPCTCDGDDPGMLAALPAAKPAFWVSR